MAVQTQTGLTDNDQDDEDEVDSRKQRVLPQSKNRLRSLRIRAVSTVVLIGSFIGCVAAGHVPLMFMIFGIQVLMVRELFRLADRAQRQQKKPEGSGNFMKWYFFCVAAFWLYVRFVNTQLAVEITSNRVLAQAVAWIWKGHAPICFLLYTAGFVAFVLKLKKGYYLYQFGQYAWTHLILLFVFVPSSFFVANIFDGIIWFLLPCSLVIVNDIGAYLAGIAFGRTPLIKISPKKTWEGFFGGMLATLAAAWLLGGFMSRFQWMICPRTDLSMGALSCEPSELYQHTRFRVGDVEALIPPRVLDLLGQAAGALPPRLLHEALWPLLDFQFTARPMQLHAIVLALCASIIAPFGGFFASGFKRSFKVKDFGNSIPGHGGMTDRMDCQVVMAVLSYLYYNNYAAPLDTLSVGAVMSTVLQLDRKQQLALFQKLGNLLAEADQVPMQIAQQLTHLPAGEPSAGAAKQ